MGVGACRSVLDSKRTEEYLLDGIETFRGRAIDTSRSVYSKIASNCCSSVITWPGRTASPCVHVWMMPFMSR